MPVFETSAILIGPWWINIYLIILVTVNTVYAFVTLHSKLRRFHFREMKLN